jgi:hypothetical protein
MTASAVSSIVHLVVDGIPGGKKEWSEEEKILIPHRSVLLYIAAI